MENEVCQMVYLLTLVIHRRASGVRMTPDEKVRFIQCLFYYVSQVLNGIKHKDLLE